MPVSDYSFSNTAPAAIALGATAGDNTAPTAVALAATTPDNTAPSAKTLVSSAFDNNVPVEKTLAATAGDNTAPTPVALAATTPDNTAPTAVALPSTTPNNTAPTAVALAASTPDNNAPVAVALASTTPDNTAPTASAVASYAGTNEPPQLVVDGLLLTPTDNTVNTPTLVIEGEMSLNSFHGRTRLAAASAILRVQVQLEDAPTGGPAVIALVDGDGDPLGISVTVADGANFGETVLEGEDQLGLAADADIRAKCTTPGVTRPGGFGAVTLFLQLA